MAEFLINVFGYFAVGLFLIAGLNLAMMGLNLREESEEATRPASAHWMVNWLTFMFTFNAKYLPEKARPHWVNGQRFLLAAGITMICVVVADSLFTQG